MAWLCGDEMSAEISAATEPDREKRSKEEGGGGPVMGGAGSMRRAAE